MLLYNETVGIDKDVELEWLKWMKETHIPEVMRSGMFTNSRMYKILHDQDEATVSYSIQYFAENINMVMTYLEKFAPLIEEHRMRFKDKHVAFRTLLEEVI